MSAPEQQAAPEQPPADLRQRLAEAIRAAAYDCDGHCGLDEDECLDRHPITVAVEHHGVATDVYGPVTALAEVAAAEVEPELAKRQVRGDIWKAKAQEMEQDRDRLDTGLAALRQQLADAQAENARLRTRLDTIDTALEGFHQLLATSSRDWGDYRVDAWLYAVIVGWDCERTEHDDTCVHGAMEETAERHGWDAETIAKARRYHAAITYQPPAPSAPTT